MFGKKNTPISESLSKAQTARYLSGSSFKRSDGANAFGQKGTRFGNAEADGESSGKPESEAVVHRMSLHKRVSEIKDMILPRILDLIDPEAAAQLTRDELSVEFEPIIAEVLSDLKITLNQDEQTALEASLVDELLGHGPLEILLKDPSITDIMVNGPHQVYIERKGRLELTDVQFRNDDHVMHVANRICTRVGRRIDQTTPLADARLEDGSRVNVIVPPLAIKGPVISIRKFAEKPLDLDILVKGGSLSHPMAVFLKAASASRLNIIVSGGTGAGKTTLLNALSKLIDPGERIVTIEDAAELRLQQPHVVSLETRPKNLEGEGEISIRDLVVNSLRMRPDRIILGEVRGPECIDMLQAMNTGHEGSMCTLHANRPREALTRMENMATLSGLKYPLTAIRTQIAEAVDVIVQISRMRDGARRIVSITEVAGMEGDVIVTQELFRYKYLNDDADGNMLGDYEYTGLRPHTAEKLKNFGLEDVVMEALQ